MDENQQQKTSKGPFKIKVLNDLTKSFLTIQKIFIDVFLRNLQDKESLKLYVKQVYGPLLKFLRELLDEAYDTPMNRNDNNLYDI